MKALELLRRDIDALERELRPVAKVRDSARDRLKSTARASFLDGVQALLDAGWSKRGIADAMGVDVHTFVDWCEGKRQLPAWAIAALPAAGRVAFMRAALGWPEAEGTGTDG